MVRRKRRRRSKHWGRDWERDFLKNQEIAVGDQVRLSQSQPSPKKGRVTQERP